MKLFKKREKQVDKHSKKRSLVFAVVFLFIISLSSWAILSEFPWNGNLISWLKARESFDRGYSLSQRYQLLDAERQFQSAVKTYPADWRIYQALANTQMKMHKWAEAEGSLKKAAELKPNNLELQIALASCLISQGEKRAGDAETAAKAAVALDPVNSVALAQLALVLAREGKLEEAKKTYNGTDRLEKDKGSFWYFSGQYHMLTNELQRAETELRQAAELDKTNPEFWEAIGTVLYNKKDLEGSEYYLKRAALLNPYNSNYWAILGEVSRKQGQFLKAEESFQKASELEPNNVELLLNLGLTRFFQNEYARAETPFRKAVELAPDDPRPIRLYLKCLNLQHKYDLIQKQLFKVLSIKKNENSESWAYCADFCIKAKDFVAAQTAIDRARAMATRKVELENVAILSKRLEESKLAVAEKRDTPDELAMKKYMDKQDLENEEIAKASAIVEKEKQERDKANARKTIIPLEYDKKLNDGADLNQMNEQDNASKKIYYENRN